MSEQDKIQLFEDQPIRSARDELSQFDGLSDLILGHAKKFSDDSPGRILLARIARSSIGQIRATALPVFRLQQCLVCLAPLDDRQVLPLKQVRKGGDRN